MKITKFGFNKEAKRTIIENKIIFWKVYLNGKLIDEVPYSGDCDKEYVTRSLIDHDGYDPAIKIVKQKAQFDEKVDKPGIWKKGMEWLTGKDEAGNLNPSSTGVELRMNREADKKKGKPIQSDLAKKIAASRALNKQASPSMYQRESAKKSGRKFEQEITAMLMKLGAKPSQNYLSYPLEIETKAGVLWLHPFEDWLATRFEDVESAWAILGPHAGLSPYSGIWNFNPPKNLDSQYLAYIEDCLKDILVSKNARGFAENIKKLLSLSEKRMQKFEETGNKKHLEIANKLIEIAETRGKGEKENSPQDMVIEKTYYNNYGEPIQFGETLHLQFAGGPAGFPEPWVLISAKTYSSSVGFTDRVKLTVRAANGKEMDFSPASMYSPEPGTSKFYNGRIKEGKELTFADHAEAWTSEQGLEVPERGTPEWEEMYEKWHEFAFSDLRGKSKGGLKESASRRRGHTRMFESFTSESPTDSTVRIGFAIRTSPFKFIQDDIIEDIQSKFENKNMRDFIGAGFITERGKITDMGWDLLNDDDQKMESNVFNWLRKTFSNARDEGHGSDDALVGTLWVNSDDPEQLMQLQGAESTGEDTRVLVGSSGAWSNKEDELFRQDLSEFGKVYLDADIEFFAIPPELEEKIGSFDELKGHNNQIAENARRGKWQKAIDTAEEIYKVTESIDKSEVKIDSIAINAFAKMAWVSAFADWYDGIHSDDPSFEMPGEIEEWLKLSATGQDWFEIAPEPPPEAFEFAKKYLTKFLKRNNSTDSDEVVSRAVGVSVDQDEFYSALALMVGGHGASWFDDFGEFVLEMPRAKYYVPDGKHLEYSGV